jgi:hypothetical protein
MGAAFIASGAAVIADSNALTGVALIVIGAASIALGAVIIGPPIIVTWARQAIDRATKAPPATTEPDPQPRPASDTE